MATGSILVIDDEYGVRSGIRQILEMEGYEVDTAETGREGLAALERRPYDVALIDYRLPDVDGLSLLLSVRSREAPPTTCMITAYANIDTAIAATRQGIDFFLPKPFSPDDLVGVVETLLRHKRVKEDAERLQRENEASLRALATEQSQTRTLVACMHDLVLVVNRNGEVVLVNAAMAALLGKVEVDLIRRPVREVLPGGALEPLRNLLESSDLLDKAAREVELNERSYAASVATFRSEAGEALGRILTLADLSEVRRMAMEKSRFIRTMVHEFRSPLGAIKSLIEVGLDKSLGDRIDPYLEFLTRADARIDKLVALIGQLLSLSRIDLTARRSGMLASTAVAPQVEATLDLYRGQLKDRKLRLELELPSELPTVNVEPEDLRTILGNLVGNAIKYNRDGGLVRLVGTVHGGDVSLEVSDTGVGIKTENLPSLFTEFFREKRAATHDIEGNGLGLSIVKRLVEKAHGRVEVRSQLGEGTSFSVFLPAGAAVGPVVVPPVPTQSRLADGGAEPRTKDGGG